MSADVLPPLPPEADTISPALSTSEALAVRSAIERLQRRSPTGRRATVEARTALSLLLGRSQSARRGQLVRLALSPCPRCHRPGGHPGSTCAAAQLDALEARR